MKILYMDGVKYLLDRCGVHWLVDLIASYQRDFESLAFQIWKLIVKKDDTALVSCREDDDEPALILQEVGYTDFPFSYELYYEDGVVMALYLIKCAFYS